MANKYSEDWGGRKKSRSQKDIWKNRQKNLDGKSYSEFLSSDYWKRVKQKAKRKKKYDKCFICGTDKRIELHHKHYDLIYTKHELHAIVPVCRTHHQAIHDYAKKTKCSLRWATRKMITLYRQNRIDDVVYGDARG